MKIRALLLVLALCPTVALAQVSPGTKTTVNQGTPASTTTSAAWPIKVVFGDAVIPFPAALGGNGGLKVECLSGCSGAAAFADNSAFTFGTTGVNIFAGIFDDTATNQATENSAAGARITQFRAIHVNLRDASGNEVSVGGGTQYTEDAAAAANPTGTALNLVRADTLAGVTSTDGDNLAARGTDKGELYVKHVDAIPVTDNGGALTVDGTVAATQSGTWNVTNVSGTVSLPTGASTLAEQQTQTTSLQKLDNVAHSGSDVALSEHVPVSGQFDDTSTTTVTENQVAPLRITSGRALHVAQQGNVTVNSHDVTNAGTFAVQAAQSGTWTVQPGNTANTTPWLTKIHDGTDAALVSGTGSLQVTCDNCGGATPFEDNDAFTAGTSSVAVMGAVVDDTATTNVSEGSAGAPRMTPERALHVDIQDTSIAATQSGTWNVTNISGTVSLPTGASTLAEQQTQTTALQLIDDTVATTASAIPTKGVAVSGTDGTNARVLKTDTGGELQVDVLTMPTTTVTGTVTANAGTGSFTVAQATAANLKGQVEGTTAHNGTAPNPVNVGGKAYGLGSAITETTDGNLTQFTATRDGVQYVIGGHPNTTTRECTVLDADGAQTGTACITVAAGVRIVVTAADVTCSKANSVNVAVRVGFDTDATFAAASTTGVNGFLLNHRGVAPGSGVVKGNGLGIVGAGASDEDLRYSMDDPTGGGCVLTVTYFTEG